ncbi:MAG: YfiR family protein [Nitrospina sp.]|nr:MAG: YfiR family protein [Nitrospina sp.]TDJ61607.1 MAG: YfiR family protein [Nitrospina sp.]
MSKFLRHWMAALAILWAWFAPMAGQALAVESVYGAPVEYEVKAAFVHNFAKFIEWPENVFDRADSPLRIGILGQGPINEPLMNLNGKDVQNRSLEVTRIRNTKNLRQYHIIFVNPSEKGRTRSLLRRLKGTGILTIGDLDGFAEQGGAFNFYLEEGKVRFEINDCAAHRENLKISSKLLRLARIVCSNNR